ncbi:MAG: ComEC/Rec2 family competence protein [Clostridium sp.]
MYNILIGIILGISWGIMDFPTFFNNQILDKIYSKKYITEITNLQKIYLKTSNTKILNQIISKYLKIEYTLIIIKLCLLIIFLILIYILIHILIQYIYVMYSKKSIEYSLKYNNKYNNKIIYKKRIKIIIFVSILTFIIFSLNNMYIEKMYIHDNILQEKKIAEKVIRFVPKNSKSKSNNIKDNQYIEETEYIEQNYLKDDIKAWKQKYKKQEIHTLGKGKYIVYFLDKRIQKNNKKYIVAILKSNGENCYTTVFSEIQTKKDYELGKIYLVQGRLEKYDFKRNYKGYNLRYANYSKKIYFKIINHNDNIYKQNNSSIDNIFLKLILFKHKIIQKILRYREDFKSEIAKRFKNSAIIQGLIIADTNNIDEEVKEEFKNVNIYHILAVSGTHLAYLILILDTISNKIKVGKIIKNLIYILIISPFIVIVGFSSSVLRAGGIVILKSILELLNIKADFKYYLSCILCIILILRPYKIIDIGLYLSFLGAISIIYTNILIIDIKKLFRLTYTNTKNNTNKKNKNNIINNIINSIIKIYNYYYIYTEKLNGLKMRYQLKETSRSNIQHFNRYSKVRMKDIFFQIQKINIYILEKIISITIVAILNSIAVSIIILPVMWYNFGTINLNFIFANILLLPIFGIIIVVGLMYLMFFPILSIVNKYIFKEAFLTVICMIIDKSISLLLNIISKLQKLNFLNLTVSTPNILIIVIYYIFLIYVYLKIQRNIQNYIQNTSENYIEKIQKIY